MAEPPRIMPRVVWVYDHEHDKHPFIRLALDTLVEAGSEVAIVNRSPAPHDARYTALCFLQLREAPDRWRWRIDLVNRCYGSVDRHLTEILRAIRRRRATAGSLWRLCLGGTERLLCLAKAALLPARELTTRLTRRVNRVLSDYEPIFVYSLATMRLLATPADVIVATRPGAGLMGLFCARLKQKRLVYYPFELYGDQAMRPSRLLRALERAMLRMGVDALITQNEARLAIYRNERGYQGPSFVIPNYKRYRSVRHSGLLRQRFGLGQETRIVLYEGDLVDGRWLEELIMAAHMFPGDTRLILMGRQRGLMRKLTIPRLVSEGIIDSNRVLLHDPVPQDELLEHVTDADVGVIIYDNSVRNNLFCAPGKLCDYVFAGVPIVAPRFPTLAPLVESMRLGICFDRGTPEAIATAVLDVLTRGRDAYAADLRRASDVLRWEQEAPKLIAAITGTTTRAAVPREPVKDPIDTGVSPRGAQLPGRGASGAACL